MADASLTHGVWLERVPDLVAECVDEWGLQLGEPKHVETVRWLLESE